MSEDWMRRASRVGSSQIRPPGRASLCGVGARAGCGLGCSLLGPHESDLGNCLFGNSGNRWCGLAARDADGDDEDCEKDGHGSDGGKSEEVDEGVIEAEGEQESSG